MFINTAPVLALKVFTLPISIPPVRLVDIYGAVATKSESFIYQQVLPPHRR